MEEVHVNQKKFIRALKKAAESGDLLDMPTWLLGSKEDPSFVYGVIIGTRELVSSILVLDSDFEIKCMIRTGREETDELQ